MTDPSPDLPAPQLLTTLSDGVLQLTLNRPAKRNALSAELYDALLAALSAASTDPAVRCIVLTGAGNSFCAGGDVGRMADTAAPGADAAPTFEDRVARLRRRTRIVELLHTMEKPSIAMLRGPAVGAGLSLALACDLRLGDASASMKTGFLQAGLPGDFGGHYFLARVVGAAKASELYLLSETLDAATCLHLGLLNRLVEAERLQDHVESIARAWAAASGPALAHIKRNLAFAGGRTLVEVLDEEAWRHVRCVDTPEHRTAVARLARRA